MAKVERCQSCGLDAHDGGMSGCVNMLLWERDRFKSERDLFASIVSDPAQLLNHLLDAAGVEPSTLYTWAGENGETLPAHIRIPRDLAVKVFGTRANPPLEVIYMDPDGVPPNLPDRF